MRPRILAALVALALLLTGCAGVPKPDPMAVSVGLSNGLALAIDEATRQHEADLAVAIVAEAAPCPREPRAAADACEQQAAIRAQDKAAPAHLRLVELALLQKTVARLLREAQQCRRDGADCELERLAEADGKLATARALLRMLASPPAPAPTPVPAAGGGIP